MQRVVLMGCSIVLVTLSCLDIDRTIPRAGDDVLATLAQFQRMTAEHRASIVEDAEPGPRLAVLGRLVRKEDNKPLAFHNILFYQADSSGNYDESEPGDEASARIRGTVMTDSAGRFLLQTVLPGDYGSTADNRHIHMAVAGAKPEAYDFYFRQYINRGLMRWATVSDQAVVLDLVGDNDILLATTDLPVRGVEIP